MRVPARARNPARRGRRAAASRARRRRRSRRSPTRRPTSSPARRARVAAHHERAVRVLVDRPPGRPRGRPAGGGRRGRRPDAVLRAAGDDRRVAAARRPRGAEARRSAPRRGRSPSPAPRRSRRTGSGRRYDTCSTTRLAACRGARSGRGRGEGEQRREGGRAPRRRSRNHDGADLPSSTRVPTVDRPGTRVPCPVGTGRRSGHERRPAVSATGRGRAQRPSNTGLRFSVKAATPSAKSCDERSIP